MKLTFSTVATARSALPARMMMATPTRRLSFDGSDGPEVRTETPYLPQANTDVFEIALANRKEIRSLKDQLDQLRALTQNISPAAHVPTRVASLSEEFYLIENINAEGNHSERRAATYYAKLFETLLEKLVEKNNENRAGTGEVQLCKAQLIAAANQVVQLKSAMKALASADTEKDSDFDIAAYDVSVEATEGSIAAFADAVASSVFAEDGSDRAAVSALVGNSDITDALSVAGFGAAGNIKSALQTFAAKLGISVSEDSMDALRDAALGSASVATSVGAGIATGGVSMLLGGRAVDAVLKLAKMALDARGRGDVAAPQVVRAGDFMKTHGKGVQKRDDKSDEAAYWAQLAEAVVAETKDDEHNSTDVVALQSAVAKAGGVVLSLQTVGGRSYKFQKHTPTQLARGNALFHNTQSRRMLRSKKMASAHSLNTPPKSRVERSQSLSTVDDRLQGYLRTFMKPKKVLQFADLPAKPEMMTRSNSVSTVETSFESELHNRKRIGRDGDSPVCKGSI